MTGGGVEDETPDAALSWLSHSRLITSALAELVRDIDADKDIDQRTMKNLQGSKGVVLEEVRAKA